MTLKEKIVNTVQELPADASFEDAMGKLYFMSKLEKGIHQADSGQTLSHMQVRENMAKWRKK